MNWQRIYTTNSVQTAHLLKAVLEENSIPTVIMDKKISFYDLGDCEIMVPSEEVLKAIKIISENIEAEQK